MASSTVVYAFDDRDEAERAVDELEHAGFSEKDVGFAIRGKDVVAGGMLHDAQGAKDGAGAATGAATGGIIGGLLGAAAAAMIPGVGPVLAGGILASAIGGAAAGAAAGGIFGAISGLEVSEEEALHYQKVFDDGKALVFVKPGQRVTVAEDIVRRHGGFTPHVHH